MLDRVESILLDECQLDKGRPILAGVSGGPDSLCLLSLLHEAGWQVIAAHFNHMLRPEAGEEAAAVEALAAGMGIAFVGAYGDVRLYASQQKISVETAARELRYRFLFEQAAQRGAQAVAVGHTADDQVETVLMHFVRGAGLNGLKGMPYRSNLREFDPEIPLVRPLLDLWRADTLDYCQAHGLQPHFDLSNDSLDFLRNRMRHELIPTLELYNPRFREALWRASRTLSFDHELLNAALEPLWHKAVLHQSDEYVALDLDFTSAQRPGVQMHLLHRATQRLLPGFDIAFDALQRGAALIADPTRERSDLAGGLFLLCEDKALYVAVDEEALPAGQWPQMVRGVDSVCLSVGIEVPLAGGWRFALFQCLPGEAHLPQSWLDADPFEAWIDGEGLPGQLELRVRRLGDRFQPLGMDGYAQKLSDFFVNVKLPRRARARWPLLCAGEDVIWVPGFRPDHSHRLRDSSRNILRLKITPPH